MKNVLEELIHEFNHWRENRQGLQPTPEPLKEKAYQLLAYYPKSVLAKHLGVNHQFFNRIEQEKTRQAQTFVALDQNQMDGQHLKATITYHNISLQIEATRFELVQLIKSLQEAA